MRRLLSVIIVLSFLLCLIPIPTVATAADRVAVTNENVVTGADIVAEARKWANVDADYWSASSPWPTCIAWRTGFTTQGQTSFDCCGFISRVLNDLGFRGEEIVANYSCVLRDEYGAYFIDSTIAGICNYATDITAEVQKAKNGDYSGLRVGDIIGWLGDRNLANHIIIYAGLDSQGRPTTVEFTGAGYKDRVIPASYEAAFQFGARFTENEKFPFAEIDEGEYYLENSNGNYLNVENAIESNGQNIDVAPFSEATLTFELKKSSIGYTLRPSCCESGVLNNYGYTVEHGNNITVWEPTGHESQAWAFLAVEGGYEIRSVMNPDCALAVSENGNVYVSGNESDPNRTWNFENLISFDANGGENCPDNYIKPYGASYTIPDTVPKKEGFIFAGWSLGDGVASYQPSYIYSSNTNASMYALWVEEGLRFGTNLALSKSYEVSATGAGFAQYTASLTDGNASDSLSYDDNWFAFYNNPSADANVINAPEGKGYVVIDLGDTHTIRGVKMNLINAPKATVEKPEAIKIYVSEDGEGFSLSGSVPLSDVESAYWATAYLQSDARYVKLEFTLGGIHAFLNEIEIYDEAEYLLGDVNADGAIDQYDYILVKRHYFETRKLTDEEFVRGDVNNDTKVDQYDYILIARHYFGTYVIG